MSVLARIPAIGASAGATTALNVDIVTEESDFFEAVFIPDGVVGAPAATANLQLNYLRNGVLIGGGSLAAGAITASLPGQKPFTLTPASTPAPSLTVGDVLQMAYVQGASGAALPAGMLRVGIGGRNSGLMHSVRTQMRLAGIASGANTTALFSLHTARSLGQVLLLAAFVPDTALTPAQLVTLNLNIYRNDGVQVGADGVAGQMTLLAGLPVAAGQPLPFSIQSGIFLIPGDVVALKYAQGGTGQALPAGILHAIFSTDLGEVTAVSARIQTNDAQGALSGIFGSSSSSIFGSGSASIGGR